MEIAKEMDDTSKKLISELKWSSENQTTAPDFNINMPIFKTKISEELTKDAGVTNETIRILPINNKTIQVAITDASLPSEKCEQIAIEFAKQLYEKATGKTLTKKQILIKKTATLQENICEYCLKPLDSLPYQCPYCRRTFCYDHRKPENHGCQPKIKTKPKSAEQTKPKNDIINPSKSQSKPKIIIRKLPCA